MSGILKPRGRGRPRKDEVALRGMTEESGAIYLTSTGNYYTEPRIDLDLLIDYSDNYYIGKIRENRRRLIFTEKYKIWVRDQNGDPRADLQRYLTTMCDRTGVHLWNRMKTFEDDKFVYGSGVANIVWGWNPESGTTDIVKIRRLPPQSLKTCPEGSKIYSEFLRGVIWNEKSGEVECWQVTEKNSKPTLLKNVYLIKDPNSPDIAGKPDIIPLVPLITMIKFAWNCQMQKANRIGAPIIFLKITNPTKDDIEFGNTILRNWGKDTAYQLRDNMELIDPHITDSSTAMEIVDALAKMLGDFFSPATLISKDGALVSGSSAPEHQLLQAYIRGIHADIEDVYEPLLQKWLDINGFEGFTVELAIPSPDNGVNEIELKRGDVAHKTQCASLNEKRSFVNLPPVTGGDAITAEEIVDYYQSAIADIPNTSNHGTKQVIGAPQIMKQRGECTCKHTSEAGAGGTSGDEGFDHICSDCSSTIVEAIGVTKDKLTKYAYVDTGDYAAST